MQITLEDKVAVVTGVSGDGQVGQIVAEALAKNGAKLAICSRSKDKVEARAEELRALGATVLVMAGSLTDEDQVKQLADDTVLQFGRIVGRQRECLVGRDQLVIFWQFQDDIAGLEVRGDPPAAAEPGRRFSVHSCFGREYVFAVDDR